MSENANAVPAPANDAAQTVDTTNPTTASAAASTNVDGFTSINSMEDLKKKSPELYRMMMEGIAMNICRKMQRNQEHLKQIMREATRNSQGG